MNTIYTIILGAHNILRWIVLILGIVATVRAYLGWLNHRSWTPQDKRWGTFFTSSIDTQLLLGLLLYFILSPLTTTALRDFGAAMGNAELRFFALEHVLYMVLAVVFAHLGSALPRRAPTDTGKFQRTALWFTLALLVILIGMPWGRPIFPGLGGV